MYPGNKGTWQKLKGKMGKQGSGKILPINPLDYQSEKLSYKPPGNKWGFLKRTGKHAVPLTDPL